jgi:hypothetical protein
MVARSEGLETRLERRPEATSYVVDDLMELVRDGRVRVPAFQRGLRWNDRDRIDLFDSIYKGYPIGTLLLWKREGGAESVTFGDFSVDAAKINDALFLVDGQQRVTTLASTLLVPRREGERAMAFDLETQEFRYARIRGAGPQGSLPSEEGKTDVVEVPVQILFDSSALIQWLASSAKARPKALVDRALECGKRLREYRVPAYIVESASLDVLRIVFDRTNRTGKRLDEVDVFNALLSTLSSGGAPQELKRVVQRLESVGFGALPENTVLKALRAILELPLDKDFTKELEPSEVPNALDRTEAALERTVRFLKAEAQIAHFVLNPYELPIVVLARFFDRFLEPSPRSRLLLRRWLWRGSLAGQLTGASVSLRQHVDAVRSGEESESVQRILKLNQVSSAVLDVEIDSFRLSTARTSTLLCALASLEPRNLGDSTPLDLPKLLSDPERAVQRISRDNAPGLTGTIANRLLHPTVPARDLVERLLEADDVTLASHAVPPDARDALARDDIAGFLEVRVAFIRRIARDFFSALAEIGADDSQAIASIQVEETG